MLKLKFSEIFEFSNENSWILQEFWPNSDLNSSFGSVPRRPNLSTQVDPTPAVLSMEIEICPVDKSSGEVESQLPAWALRQAPPPTEARPAG